MGVGTGHLKGGQRKGNLEREKEDVWEGSESRGSKQIPGTILVGATLVII